MSNPWIQIQTDIAAQLATAGALATVPMLTDDPNDALSNARRALFQGALPANASNKSGVCILIQTISSTADGNSRTELGIETTRIRISVFEVPAINRDTGAGIGISAWDVGWTVRTTLQGWTNNVGLAPSEFIGLQTDEGEGGIFALLLDFQWTLGLSV